MSKDGVIGDLSFSLSSWKGSSYTGATCLQFNYTALAEGSVDVTLTYYYNFNQSGVINGTAYLVLIKLSLVSIRCVLLKKFIMMYIV